MRGDRLRGAGFRSHVIEQSRDARIRVGSAVKDSAGAGIRMQHDSDKEPLKAGTRRWGDRLTFGIS